MPEPAMYDTVRGGAIWNERMASTDGEAVAANMIRALRERSTGVLPKGCGGWQNRTLDLSYEWFEEDEPPTPGDVLFFATGSNVLIEMRADFLAQVAEAKARGEFVPNAKDAT